MTDWIDTTTLMSLVPRCSVEGAQSLGDIVATESRWEVSKPASPALDLATYEVRYRRWREEGAPSMVGMEEFMAALRDPREPTVAVTVKGTSTTYILLLSGSLNRLVAAVAIDRPGLNR